MIWSIRQLRREADLRFGLIRVRENAESIALYQGEERRNDTRVAPDLPVEAELREEKLGGVGQVVVAGTLEGEDLRAEAAARPRPAPAAPVC